MRFAKKRKRTENAKTMRKSVRKFCKSLIISVYCGEGGIRTPGGSHLNSFQDCRNRPLYHLSCRTAKICIIFLFFQEFLHKTQDLITLCYVQIVFCRLYLAYCCPFRMQWPGRRQFLFRQGRCRNVFANNQVCFRVRH